MIVRKVGVLLSECNETFPIVKHIGFKEAHRLALFCVAVIIRFFPTIFLKYRPNLLVKALVISAVGLIGREREDNASIFRVAG